MNEATLRELAERYPANLVGGQLADIPRIAFHLTLLPGSARSVCDLGGGIGLFSLAVASSGREVTLIDDFSDQVNWAVGDSVLELHRSLGVRVISRDVAREGLPNGLGSVDVITAFETLEHWHNSPRAALHQAVERLNPDGALIISLPNCVDLPKRVLTPLGLAQWSSFNDWYYQPAFRAHVREAHPNDLRRIAQDLGLRDARLFGRNWQIRRRLGGALDRLIRSRTFWCSELYLIGQKGQ